MPPVAVTRVRGRLDEIILAEVKRVSQGPEDRGIPIDERPNWDSFPIGGQHIRQAILIGAGQEVGIVTQHAMPARDGVTDNRCVGVPDVGARIHVINRGRNVKLLPHLHFFSTTEGTKVP